MLIILVHAYFHIYYVGVRIVPRFHRGTGPILLAVVNCTGNESSLLQCSHKRNHNCSHSEDIAIQCGMKQNIYAYNSVLWLVEMNFGLKPQSFHYGPGHVFDSAVKKIRSMLC